MAGWAAKGKGERRYKTAGHRRNTANRRMLRLVSAAIREAVGQRSVSGIFSSNVSARLLIDSTRQRCFGALSSLAHSFNNPDRNKPVSLIGPAITNIQFLPLLTPTRTLTKFSAKKGKRKTVKAVIKRFKRLHWGAWIRTKVGRHSTLWRKKESTRRRLRQHVFCNGQQSHLFDIMVTNYWRRPHYYVNDIYEPYHIRNEFPPRNKKL